MVFTKFWDANCIFHHGQSKNSLYPISRGFQPDHDCEIFASGSIAALAGTAAAPGRKCCARPPSAGTAVVIRTLFIIKQMSNAFHIECLLTTLHRHTACPLNTEWLGICTQFTPEVVNRISYALTSTGANKNESSSIDSTKAANISSPSHFLMSFLYI